MTAVRGVATVPEVAVKEPVVAAAATVTLAGTVRLALLLVRATTAPSVGAGPLKLRLQALVPGPVKEDGAHVRVLTVTGAFMVIAALALPPLAAAVIVPVQSLAIVPAVAEKVAVEAPAATVSEAGAVSAALFEEMATETPPAGAAILVVTVQMLLAPEFKDVGAQTSAVTFTSGARLREAVLELPFNAAVTTAVRGVATVPAVAVKEPVVAVAATVTLAGTVRLALLLVKVTTAPPVGAGPLKLRLQALVPGPVKEDGAHVRVLTVTGAFRVIAALALPPLAAAVTVPVESLAIVPAVAEKVAVEAPAAMVREAGAVSAALFEEMATETPPAGAAELVVTVQMLLAPEFKDVGAQTSAVTFTAGARLREAVLELPFSAAVMTAVKGVATVPAVAVKEPVVAAAATVTLAGTVRLALLLVKGTTAPPVGAGPLKLRLQALVPGPVKEDGVQVSPITVTSAFRVIAALALPPLAAAVIVPVQSLAIVPAVAEKVA